MFETRVRIVFIFFIACWLVVVLRLFQLQVVQAGYYRALAEQRVTLQAESIEPIRGAILDRKGHRLASEEPTWAIALHYKLLVKEPAYLQWLSSGVGEADEGSAGAGPRTSPVLMSGLLERLWLDLAYLSQCPEASLRDEADAVERRVRGWKNDYLRRRGFSVQEARPNDEIQEERECHAIVHDLTSAQQIDARLYLMEEYGFLMDAGALSIINTGRRFYHDAECVAHIVGGMGSVSEQDVQRRPYRRDGRIADLGGYKRSDRRGLRGVEWLAEELLRGQRGTLTAFLDDRPDDRVEPIDGRDVYLTIDYHLQKRIYEMLGRQVQAGSLVPGGSVVVLDILSRQALALVSYPAYDPNRFGEQYDRLSADALHLPLLFRAVGAGYQPGSIVKPLTIVAAHATGVITPQTTHECAGALFPEREAGQRRQCWIWPRAHGLLNSEETIKKSCNVFCFKVGQELGVDRLCAWMDMAGIGRPSGTGLREEISGILPTSSFLASRRHGAVTVGDAWNFSIGQGELLITPVQAANLVATYASGVYRPVQLLQDGSTSPSWQLPADDDIWHLIRRGMHQGVNAPDGTSRAACLEDSRYVLCGKSGSAQTSVRVLSYRIDFLDDNERAASEVVPAGFAGQARETFLRAHPEQVGKPISIHQEAVWPVGGDEQEGQTHAWFVGFIQPKRPDGQPDWQQAPPVAIAVLLEFGGSGGSVSGPLCRDIARLILQEFPEYAQFSRQSP